MKILHWEYHEELFAHAQPDSPKHEILIQKDVSGKKVTGLSFRWSYQASNENKTALLCIAEDTYKLKSGKADYYLVKYLLENSYYSLKVALQEKLNMIGLPMIKPDFTKEEFNINQVAMRYNQESLQ